MTEEERSIHEALKASWNQRGELIELLCKDIDTEKIIDWLEKQNLYFDE